jgi:hypothetical protein
MRARSSWPSRSSPARRSELSSVKVMPTPGYLSWNPARSSARTGNAHPLAMPTVTCPRTRPASSSTARRAFATASRAARANGSTADPTSVSRTERPERSSSCCPSSDSSRRTCALTPGCATCTLVAARVKLASSATTTKLRSHFRSMSLPASMRRCSAASTGASPHRRDLRSGITSQGRPIHDRLEPVRDQDAHRDRVPHPRCPCPAVRLLRPAAGREGDHRVHPGAGRELPLPAHRAPAVPHARCSTGWRTTCRPGRHRKHLPPGRHREHLPPSAGHGR